MGSTEGYVKWKKPDTERHLSYVSYMETKANSGLKVELYVEQEVDRGRAVDKDSRE